MPLLIITLTQRERICNEFLSLFYYFLGVPELESCSGVIALKYNMNAIGHNTNESKRVKRRNKRHRNKLVNTVTDHQCKQPAFI